MAGYPLDSQNEGWIKGWAVYRNSPWHLEGIFLSQKEAEARRNALGGPYTVAYGARRLGSNDFIEESPPQG
jgi:hypothetical protein